MKYINLFFFCFLTICIAQAQSVTRWDLNRLDTIGGYGTYFPSIVQSPVLINTLYGNAFEFDGVNDGIFVSNNPMNGLTEFTIEVIFKPYAGGDTAQRFIHFQQDNNNRILVEMRYYNGSWYLDTFIKSGLSSRTLIDKTKIHDMDKWYHLALTYKSGVMTHYVDGIQELTGSVTYATVSSGQTSIGVRQTLVNYFKGAIKTIKITGESLVTTSFITQEATDLNSILGADKAMNKEDESIGLTYPLPGTENVKLLIKSSKGERIKMELFNATGTKVQDLIDTVITNDTFEFEIQRNGLPNGTYYVRVQMADQYSARALMFE